MQCCACGADTNKTSKCGGFVCGECVSKLKESAPSASTNTGMDAIAEMDKAVRCLAIQVPESVYDDVKRRWDAVVAQQRHA